jgi:hypothetical protein
MMASTSGCEVSPRLEGFSEVFCKWVELFANCNASFPQAGNFWYNEPGLVSMPCSAAWLVGLPALTEARTKKTDADSPLKWSGHADLMIRRDSEAIAVEAKLTWLSADSPGKQVLECLRGVCQEAICLPPEIAGWRVRRVGMVFGMFSLDGEIDPLPACSNALAEIRRKKHDVLAWSTFRGRRDEQCCAGGLLAARVSAIEDII